MNNPITPKDYCGECNATLPPKFCAEIVGTTTTTNAGDWYEIGEDFDDDF